MRGRLRIVLRGLAAALAGIVLIQAAAAGQAFDPDARDRGPRDRPRRDRPFLDDRPDFGPRGERPFRAPRRPPMPRGPARHAFAVSVALNAIDRAHYMVARIYIRRDDYKKAAKELTDVVENSPDDEAVSATHFNLAEIHRRRLHDPARAVAHYKQVQGELAERAAQAVLETYAEVGDFQKAAQELEARLAEAETPAQKVMLLNQMAQIHVHAGDSEKAIATYRRIPEVITYEEAAQLEKEWAQERPEERGDQDGPRHVHERIRELHEAGRHEEAERLEMELRRSRFRDDGKRFEGPGPEAIKREIMELREHGHHDEAHRLENKLADLTRPRPEAMRGRGSVKWVIERLKDQIEELRKAGRDEQAERVERRIRQLERLIERGRERPRGEERDDDR